jgi:hypothetical protein
MCCPGKFCTNGISLQFFTPAVSRRQKYSGTVVDGRTKENRPKLAAGVLREDVPELVADDKE